MELALEGGLLNVEVPENMVVRYASVSLGAVKSGSIFDSRGNKDDAGVFSQPPSDFREVARSTFWIIFQNFSFF